MDDIHNIITDNIDIWTSAIEKKKATGRGSSKKHSLHGIKKLRELILDLAVRGKLVTQDLRDEPASVLLEKIKTEKEQLIKDKKIKKSKKLPNEKKADIPKNWVLCRLGELVSIQTGKKDVNAGHIDGTYPFFSCAAKPLKCNSYSYNFEALLLPGNGANVGQVFRYNGKFEAYQRTYILSSFYNDTSYYIEKALQANFLKSIEGKQYGSAINYIKLGNLTNFLILLPPENEQKRIVSKVNELMALCDKLEQETEDSIEAHKTLVEVLLNTLTNSSNHEELTSNWSRISEHFDSLFTTEESIEQLKQTILQLAVMGKLVPQDPTDEPASVLLEKIKTEKEQLIKDKKIKKPKKLPEITDEEIPFDIPEGWVFAQADNLCNPKTIITYGILKPIWLDSGIPTVRIKDMKNGEISLKEIASCCSERASKFLKTELLEGDLLIAKDGGTLGKTAFVPKELSGGNITQHVLRFSISKYINSNFIRFYIDSPLGQKWMKGETKGVALPGVNVLDFRRMVIGLPPINEQDRIVSKINELMSICDELTDKLMINRESKVLLADSMVMSLV